VVLGSCRGEDAQAYRLFREIYLRKLHLPHRHCRVATRIREFCFVKNTLHKSLFGKLPSSLGSSNSSRERHLDRASGVLGIMSRWLVLCCAALVMSGAHSADSASAEALLSLLQQQPTEDLALAATGDLPVLTRNDATHLIQLSMHRGWFELAKKIVDVSIASGIDVSHAVHQTGASYVRRRHRRFLLAPSHFKAFSHPR